MSLRTRLVATSLLTLAIGLGALLAAGNLLLAARVRSEASSMLLARAEAQVGVVSTAGGVLRTRASSADGTLDRQAWVLSGDRVVERPAGAAPALDRAAVALGRTRRPTELEGPGDVRLRAQPVRSAAGRPIGAVVVGLSVEPLEQLRVEVLFGSLVVAGLVLAAGGLAVRRAVGGALRPVASMTAAAEDWGAHDLDRRFGLGPPRDELTGLAATLDHLLARIAASRRHEQRFAAEVAHELRTPLAGLRGRAELALDAPGPGGEAERAAALHAVVGQATRLDTTITDLLTVARQELDPADGAVDLLALAHEVEDVEVSAPSDLPAAEGAPEVVRRALAPLIDNARRHATSRVRLELAAAGDRVRVAVRDDGPGLDRKLGEDAFEPGVRAAGAAGPGAGLGLALARRLARSCGGDVVQGPGPGGCFVLELPAAAFR